jgi:2-dehydro-3-deoxyphosphogluconate aldolase/(4S)-4-hydroxy-2-oxoglutarate aldolase
MALAIPDVLARAPLIPVVTIADAALAPPLAAALVAGGLAVIEVTLRTPAALEAIARIAAEVPAAIVGAGTLLTPEDFGLVRAAGAAFAVSPGLTPRLAAAAADLDLPWLPGVATPTEAMAARERGFRRLKFFPADAVGGPRTLAHLGAILPDLVFCPTGGVSEANLGDYLRLSNVACCGASYVATAAAIAAADWTGITARAAIAAAARG